MPTGSFHRALRVVVTAPSSGQKYPHAVPASPAFQRGPQRPEPQACVDVHMSVFV